MPNPLDHLYDELKVKYPDFVDRGEFVSKLSNEDELKKLHQAATQSFKGFVGFDDFKLKVGESLSTYDQDSDYKTQNAASTGQENAETVNTARQQEEIRPAPSKQQNSGIESEVSVPDGSTATSADAEAFDRETGDLDELGRRYDDKVKRLEGYGATEGLSANEEAARKHYEAYTRLLDEAEQDRLAYNRRVKAAEDERAEQQRQLDLQSKDRKTRRSAEYGGYTNDQVRKEQERLKKERAYLEDPKSKRNADYSRRVMEYNADQTALSGEADKRNKSYERKRAMYDEVKTIAEDPDVQERITGNDTVAYVLSGNNPYALQSINRMAERAKTMTDEELFDTCKTIAWQKYARGYDRDIYAPLAGSFLACYNELMYRMGGDEPKSALEMRYDMIDKATEGTPEGDRFMLSLRNYLDGTAGMGTANYETDDSERANIPQFAIADIYNDLVFEKDQENMRKVEQRSRYPLNEGGELDIAAAATDINYDEMLQQAYDKFGEEKLRAYIVAHALHNGISIDESAQRVNQSIWNATIGKEMEEYRPKSNFEFFVRRILSDNTFSKLTRLGIRGRNGNMGGTDPFALNTMVLDEYAKEHPGWDTAAVVTNFAVIENPFFSVYSKAASGLVGVTERTIIGAATKTAEKTAIESTMRALNQSFWYRLAKGGATGALVGFQYGTMSGAIDQAYYNGDVNFGKVIANGIHMGRDFSLMHGVGELFGVTGDAILRRGQRNLRNGQGVLRNRIETTSLHFLNNVAKTTTNASIVTGLYAAIDKPALERENKKIEAENKKIEAENARLPEDQQKPLKPLNQIASVEDTFYSSLRMFAGLDAVGMLRSAWSIGVRGQYERNKHVKVHFDKFDREALEKAFGKNPNSLLRQIVFGNVDGVPAKWFEIDPEAEQEIYKELGRELTPAEKEAYATYGFTELRKIILNKDIPWATRAKIVSVITGRVVQEPPVAKGDIQFEMDSSGTQIKRIIVKSLDLEGNVIQATEFSGKEFEAARRLVESLNDRGWRNNAMLCGDLVIDAIEDKTYADTVDEMAREKGIAPEQFEQMVFGIKQKDITGEKVTYQERQLVDEFDKRHQEKQDAEIKLTGPDKLFEQIAREVFGAEWKQANAIPFKSWGEMTEAEKEFVNKYIERMGAMGVAERNKLMNANPDWVRTAKEYEESVRRRMEEAERPAKAEPLPALEDEKVSVETPVEERVEPTPEVIELEEEKHAEQPTERERFDAERKEKAATITDADIEANREALGIPEGTALTDEARQIYAEDLAEDLMRYERFKRGESDEKARFHDYWESKFNPKRPKLEKPIEKQEEPEDEEFEEEEVTEADALIEQFDNLKGRSDLERYRNALKVFAGDDEIMSILEDLEPHDITEWVSSFLGLDSGKGYSMLWESKTRGGTVIAKGFKEETGWSWNDVKGFAFMFDNKNGMSPRRVSEKIWEELPSGIKDRYSDVDVFNIMMDLFGQSSRKSDITGYIRNNRMEQVRELLNRRRSNELDEIARYKERERRGDEEPVAPPVSDDEEQNEFTVREDEVAPFSLLSLSYRDEEVESGTIRSRARTRKQLGTIAKALGYKIRWVADKPYNAKIDTDEKVLSVNIRTDRPLESVIGHEITHDLRKSDPEAYEALKRYAQDMLGEEQWDYEVKDVTDTYNEEYKRRGWEPIRADKAEEEVVCDTMGKVLHTRKGLRELAGSLDPGVAGKVYRLIKGITNKVKSALGKDHDYSTIDLALRDFLNAVEQRAKKDMPIQDAPIEDDFDIDFSLRRKPAPKKTGVGYKVFFLKDGKLYPPMVANIGGEATPFGVWLDADAAPIAGKSKTGRNKVKAGGKGTQGGSGTLAYRPGWHLGKIPYALQFNRGKKVPNPLGILNKKGQVIEVGELFPNDFVWAEVEYAADKDYQEEAHGYGVNANGKYNPSLAGLPRVPEDGSYEYRTNPNPATDPWIITGAMKVNKILKPSEVDAMVRAAGREPQKRQEGAFTDEQIDVLNRQLSSQATDSQHGLSIDPSGGYSVTDKADIESLAPRMDGESEAAYNERIAEIGADEKAFVDGDGQFSLKREDSMRDNSVKYFEEYHVRGNKDRKYGPLRRNSITRQALDKANEMIAEMRDYIAPWYDREAGGNRYLPEEVYGLSTIFDNASYGATLENTLICTRTLAYNDFCDSVKRKLGRPLTKRESFLASQMLYDIATDPQCLYCYVSLDRKAYDEYLLRYFDERDAVIERYNKMADKSAENIDALYKTFLDGRKDTYQMRSRFNSWLMLADHDSAIGRDKVALSSDRKNALAQESDEEAAVRWRDITKQYNRLRGEEKKQFKQSKEYLDALHNYLATEQGQIKDACAYAQGASWAKKEAEYRSYTGELLRTTKRMLGGLASHYGLRFYSFSEYSPAFILENMQMVRDAALRGLKGFAYTKEIDFCKIFLPTGININCSTYGRRNAAGEIVMDERQGANWDEARALRDQYENMGIVFVATDDEMVRWAKGQPWIDVIIPFHIVRTGADIAEFYGWTNYTNVSADYDAQGRHKDIMPPEHNNSIEDYDRLIAERGLTRRFPQFYDGPGDQNYMKLINETRRKASDTPILTPVFNMEEAKKSFDKFVEKGGYWGGFYEVGADDVVRAVDEVAADIEAGKSAGEVEYGRQDIDFDKAMSNIEKTRRRINRNREHGNTPKTSFSLKARRMEEDKPSDHRARRERPYDLYRSDSPAAELMVSLLKPSKGDMVLEPSAGKGDIIDFVSDDNPVTAVEINPLLIPALKEKVGNGEIINEDFLNHDEGRKYPRIVMNPPFGDGGKLAIQHTEAAFAHLEDGGRLVAIIPSGKEATALFNEMMGRIEQQGAHLTMRIDMPSSLFNKQNARLKTSVVVIDRNGESGEPVIEDLSSIKDKDELYNRFDDISRQYGSGLNLDNGQFSLKREDSQKVFDTAKRKFGETKDVREAGYVLPDGTMLDFSGRHEMNPGSDLSYFVGQRYTDHRAINQISFVYDENGDEVDTGVSSDMPDFIKRGAIRIDANNGLINLSTKPTPEQRKVLRQLVAEHGGTVDVDFGDGWDTAHSAYYDNTNATRILGDIDRYFDEGIKPEGNAQFSLKKKTYTDADGNEVYTETREDGTKDREITTYGDGSKKALWYDDKGNLKERLDYFPNGEVSQVANYDSDGNLTRNIQYDENRRTTSYYLPAIGTDWKLDENGIARGKSNGVEIKPYNFQFSLKREQTHSDNFKRWFGDWENDPDEASKVVDSDGRPKVVLHGTPNNEFYAFDPEKTGSNTDQGWLGKGFYFYGNAPEYASQYAGKNGRVLQVYLDIKNPYIASVEEFNRLAEANDPEMSRRFREQLEDEGYDGVYYNGDLNEEWVAFRPEQIKSATENNGDFDPNNPDIRYSLKRRTADLDKEYVDAVKRGDERRAIDMLLNKALASVGITPYIAPHGYGGSHRDIAKRLKTNEGNAVVRAVADMQRFIPDNAVLIPMPPHEGEVTEETDTMILADALSVITGKPVIVALEGEPRESRYAAKAAGRPGITAEEMGFRKIADIPEGKVPIIIDNVVGTGETAKAAVNALGGGITLAYAKATRSKATEGLKNATITYDDKGNIIPLSKRFDAANSDVRYSLKRRRNRDDYTDEDRADAAIIANTYLAQADALRQQIEADRQREHQLVEERNRLLALEYPAADPADRPAIMDRINALRNQINDLRNANYENNTKLRSMDYEYRVAKEILEQGAVTDEEAARFDAGQMTREEKVLESLFKAAADSRADKKAKQKAIRGLVRELVAITDNFKAAMKARGIESQRKQYDKGTVDHIIRLAKAMMETGYIDNMTSYEVKRLMGMINNAATRESIETQAGRIVDMMLDHQIRTLRNDFDKQLRVTGQKTNSSGVQVQAGLDQEGQVVMEAMRKSMQIIADSAGERYDSNGNITEWGEFYEKTLNDMGDEDPVKAEQARKIFEGVWLASKWYEDVRTMEINGRILRSQMEDFKASNKPAKDADADTKRRYNDVLADYQEMLRQNKIKIIEAYERMTGDVGMTQAESVRRAKEFADAQKQRVNEIQHNANSDLADVDDNTQVETPESRVFGANKNNVLARLLFASAGTYEKFMRFFGRMAPNGEGYLFKRFMTQYHHARQDYWKGRHSAFEEMDKKMAEVFGKKKMHWSDIYEMTRDHKKFPPITVSYWDGYRNGQPFLRVDELNQSEALYLYMINKMPDGRMKLRHMGITDDVVQQMADQINYKLITLADWLQSEFLPKMRIKYNETHKRVFGADMAAIEDYFPLRINKLAVASDMDITERDINDNKPSTITGAIVKRRVNTLPIDLHTDAFDVALSHIDEMEHWSAFAEFNRDNNTLVNYKRFRTKVNNMRSLELGAGNVLWKNFTDAVAIAADAYHPRAGSRSGDHYSTRVAKFVSTAKIALRPYTALKQLLSIPAFWADSDPLEQFKATVNVADTWQWAIENLPGFAERWQSRQAGNIKLANYNDLSGLRRRKTMRKLQRAGMWANAAIDGLACAMGGKAVYETKLKRYRNMGYDEARAQEKALIDAAIAYNNSQQSSEGAYVSPLQVDRTWFANAFSVFRSASMGYTRRFNTSLRQLRNATFKRGYGVQSVEFLKKQMMRDGLTEEQAEKWAHRIYRRANLKAAASVAIFGQILPFAWNLGTNMFYLLFGDDDKEKKKILADSFRHSFFGPIEGLVGGNVYSELGDIAADTAIGNIWGDSIWGDSNAFKALGYRDFSTMPLSSDLRNVLKYFARDEVKAANEVVNILFQVATGVNPQTITDWVTAILDFSRSDMERRDIAMFAMRLLSTPQQQLDRFYLDQMNLTQEQAAKMSKEDLIKRYATYKRWRETPLTGWMYSDEREKKVEEKFQKRYEEMLEERAAGEDGLRESINTTDDLPSKRTMMRKLQKELSDSIETADPELYKKALEGEKADDDEYVRHVTDKDVEQMAELAMKKKSLRAAYERKLQADKDAEAGRITQEEYDAIYKECAHEWKLYNYLNNKAAKDIKEMKRKMEPGASKHDPEYWMDSIRTYTDKVLRKQPQDMKMKKGDKKHSKKNKNK